MGGEYHDTAAAVVPCRASAAVRHLCGRPAATALSSSRWQQTFGNQNFAAFTLTDTNKGHSTSLEQLPPTRPKNPSTENALSACPMMFVVLLIGDSFFVSVGSFLKVSACQRLTKRCVGRGRRSPVPEAMSRPIPPQARPSARVPSLEAGSLTAQSLRNGISCPPRPSGSGTTWP